MKKAEIHTEKGVMKVEFYEKDAPKLSIILSSYRKRGFMMD